MSGFNRGWYVLISPDNEYKVTGANWMPHLVTTGHKVIRGPYVDLLEARAIAYERVTRNGKREGEREYDEFAHE